MFLYIVSPVTFRAHFQACWEAYLQDNMTVLIKEQAGKKHVQVLADQTGKEAAGE